MPATFTARPTLTKVSVYSFWRGSRLIGNTKRANRIEEKEPMSRFDNLDQPIMPSEKIEAQKVSAGVAYRPAVACCSPKFILPKDVIKGVISVNRAKYQKKADECQKSRSLS